MTQTNEIYNPGTQPISYAVVYGMASELMLSKLEVLTCPKEKLLASPGIKNY